MPPHVGHPHRINPTRCPSCGFLINSAGAPAEVPRSPSPGDRTVCIKCSDVLIFNDDMSLRKMTQEEYDRLPQRVKNDIEQIILLAGVFHARN